MNRKRNEFRAHNHDNVQQMKARPCYKERVANTYLKDKKKATVSCHTPNRVYTK